MPTECSPDFFGFEPVEGRAVVVAFDAGAVTLDAGALLLGATDRTLRMMDRLASCFDDVLCPELIEHQVVTLVGQRVSGLRLAMRISTTTTSCATIRCWQCSRASSLFPSPASGVIRITGLARSCGRCTSSRRHAPLVRRLRVGPLPRFLVVGELVFGERFCKCLGQYCVCQDGIGQVCHPESCVYQVCSCQVNSSKDCSGQVGAQLSLRQSSSPV
jgi:hypothetical protein